MLVHVTQHASFLGILLLIWSRRTTQLLEDSVDVDHVTQDSFTQIILHVVRSRHTIRPLFVVWSRHSSHFLLERVARCLSASHYSLSQRVLRDRTTQQP